MKRTQIYLPEDLHEAVRRIAFEQRRTMADVVREAVAAYVAAIAAQDQSSTTDRPAVPAEKGTGHYGDGS